MASGVTRVIHRCEDALESGHLDLSSCQLVQVPDAVFHLLRDTCVKGVDLSGNVITKIPPKLPLKFSSLIELHLGGNRLGKLPEEMGTLVSLQKLDISHNAFLTFPREVLLLPQLKEIHAHHNFIENVEVDKLKGHGSLSLVDLRDNPLSPLLHTRLTEEGPLSPVKVLTSPVTLEEWELDPTTVTGESGE